jgi:hypothetical protein
VKTPCRYQLRRHSSSGGMIPRPSHRLLTKTLSPISFLLFIPDWPDSHRWDQFSGNHVQLIRFSLVNEFRVSVNSRDWRRERYLVSHPILRFEVTNKSERAVQYFAKCGLVKQALFLAIYNASPMRIISA